MRNRSRSECRCSACRGVCHCARVRDRQLLARHRNIVLPLGFLFATIWSADDRSIRALAAVSLTVLAGVLAWEDEEERAHHLLVAAIASGIAIVTYLAGFDTRCIGALALHAALFTMIFRSTRARVLVPPISIGLVIASGWTFLILQDRLPHSYTPFLTIPSLCALAVVSAWMFFAHSVKAPGRQQEYRGRTSRVTHRGCRDRGGLFLDPTGARRRVFGRRFVLRADHLLRPRRTRAHLRGALAPRWTLARGGARTRVLRRVEGAVQTFTIDAIGMRVGARILVGIFLAAVAYWYRVPMARRKCRPLPR